MKSFMLIAEYLQTLGEPIGKRTLCFLIDKQNNKILLGKKKKGFGEGNYLGIGGKVEQGESIEGATIREMQEEIGITPTNLQKRAMVTFLFPDRPVYWNQEVHVFITNSWEGNPIETEEINPEWFDKEEIPYELMWDDNKYWLPEIIQGKYLSGHFLFNQDLKVQEKKIEYKNF